MDLYAELILTLIWALTTNCANIGIPSKPKLVPYSIPELREIKKALGVYEDTYFNFTELTTKYHYPTEQHNVITEDGYILTVFRILSKCSEVRFHPVLLVHGILDSSDMWIIPGPKDGLGYVLADNCYDVWLANNRGNVYSRNHVSLNPDTDKEYWNFTFDEMGNYDLPAIIDYILNASKRPRLYCIGHSQGTTEFFALTSLRPEFNRKIRLSIQVAPVASLANIASPLAILAAPATGLIQAIIEGAGYNEFFARDQILHTLIELLCKSNPELICGEMLHIISGYRAGTISSKNLSVGFGHLLMGISTKSLAHFGQLITSRKFRRFDEGKTGNIRRYGRVAPPVYNISRITSPVLLINAYNDWLSTVKDVDILRSKLPNVVENYYIPLKYWSHNNHLWGIKAPTYVYPKILNYLKSYDSDT